MSAVDENYQDVFEEGSESMTQRTVHRMRANSTIMELKKILGKLRREGSMTSIMDDAEY